MHPLSFKKEKNIQKKSLTRFLSILSILLEINCIIKTDCQNIQNNEKDFQFDINRDEEI